MKTTNKILLAATLVFATQISIAQQTLSPLGNYNKVDKQKVEIRKERPSKQLQRKNIKAPVIKKQMKLKKQVPQPIHKKQVIVKKRKVTKTLSRR